MKKLAIVASLFVAVPAFACPMHDSDNAAPKTAEKSKDENGKTADKTPAKDTKAPAKKDEAKPAETAKAKEAPKKDDAKKPTKVSQK